MTSLLSDPLSLLAAAGGAYLLYWAMIRQGTVSRWVHKARWSRRFRRWGLLAALVLTLIAMVLHFGSLLLEEAIR